MRLFGWLGDCWTRRSDRRRYAAAWTIFLARCTYCQLAPHRQAEVRALGRSYLLAMGCETAVLGRYGAWDFWSATDALAMHTLGIPPALAGARWPFPAQASMHVRPPSLLALNARSRGMAYYQIFQLALRFPAFGPVRERAPAALRSGRCGH